MQTLCYIDAATNLWKPQVLLHFSTPDYITFYILHDNILSKVRLFPSYFYFITLCNKVPYKLTISRGSNFYKM